MKRAFLCGCAVLALCLYFSVSCRAVTLDDLDNSMSELRESVSDEVRGKLEAIGYSGDPDPVGSLSLEKLLAQLGAEFTMALSGPLGAGAVMLGLLILTSLLEGYTVTLRYGETKEVMAAITSLTTAAVLAAPVVNLIQSSVGVIGDASSLMLLYVPIMVGVIAFSGHAVASGGYYATVMTASQVIAQLSSHLFPQLMCCYLGLSIAGGLSLRLRVSGLCEMVGKFTKWFLTLMMSLFTAVLSLQSVIARAGDSLANRAVRLTLSSMIPYIGSAISESYRTIQGSVDLLRSGAGVFVILALIVMFAPVLIRAILWLLCVNLTRCAAEALGVSSPAGLLSAVASVLSVLIALIVCVTAVFLISTAVLIRIGGAS